MMNDMTDKINNFLNRFKPNCYIYISIIKRFFKDNCDKIEYNYDEVIEYMLEHNLVKKGELYICPYCNYCNITLSKKFKEFDNDNTIICYCCDRKFKKCNVSIEPVYEKK